MITIEEALSHFSGVRKEGNGWKALCPVHGDKTPSLSINAGEHGTILFTCRTHNCRFPEIVKAAGLEGVDLGTMKNGNGNGNGASKKGQNGSATKDRKPWIGTTEQIAAKAVAVYDYVNAAGEVVAKKARLIGKDGKKTFRCYGRVDTKNFKDNLRDIPRPLPLLSLAQIDEVATAGGVLAIPEGEKDCATLATMGFKTTTNIEGAGPGKWLPEYSEMCRGIRVALIFEDNDEVGRKFAREKAGSLTAVGVSCKIISFPDLPEHGDVTDWIELRHTKDELLALTEQAPVFVPEPVPVAAANSPIDGSIREVDEEPFEPAPVFPLEPFPVVVFPKPVVAFVTAVAESIGCPVDYVGVAALAVAGASIGTAVELHVKSGTDGWKEGAQGYFGIVAPPGSLKSPALRPVIRPIHTIQRQLDDEYERDLREYEEQKEQRRGKGKANEEPEEPLEEPIQQHVITSDTTVEALASGLAGNPRGILVAADELTGFVRSLDQFKNGKGADRQFYLSAWSQEPVRVLRKTSGTIIVPRPFITILGGIQPDMLGELSDGRADGFLDRFLFTFPVSTITKWSDLEVPQEVSAGWSTLVKQLRDLEPEPDGSPQAMRFTPAAKTLWIQHHDRHLAELQSPNLPPSLHGHWSKLKGYAARLILIVHAFRYACNEVNLNLVDELSVAGGWSLVEYFKSHARKVYPRLLSTKVDRKLGQIEEWIRRTGGSCSVRELQRSQVGDVKTSEQALSVLQALEKRALGRFETPAGRKAPRFRLYSADASPEAPPVGVLSGSVGLAT